MRSSLCKDIPLASAGRRSNKLPKIYVDGESNGGIERDYRRIEKKIDFVG
jgi:hypothetical protein